MNELHVKEDGVYCGFLTKMVVIDLKGKIIAKDEIDDKHIINFEVDEDNDKSF